jgi:hypothetical protein
MNPNENFLPFRNRSDPTRADLLTSQGSSNSEPVRLGSTASMLARDFLTLPK